MGGRERERERERGREGEKERQTDREREEMKVHLLTHPCCMCAITTDGPTILCHTQHIQS